MRRTMLGFLAAALLPLRAASAAPALGATPERQCAPAAAMPAATTPVAYWSTEARSAIVPVGAGPENFGNKFPGEAAVYMGIARAAIYDAAVAIEGGYETYANYEPALVATLPTSAEAAIATAAHNVLFTLDSRVTGTTRDYGQFHEVVKDVNQARVLVGFHFRNSDQQGSSLGRKVSRYVVDHFFQQEQR